MRSTLMLLVFGIVAVLGTHYSFPAYYYRGNSYYTVHLNHVKQRLEVVVSYLHTYKAKHRTYPSNDEGLGALRSVIPAPMQLSIPYAPGTDSQFIPYRDFLTCYPGGELVITEAGVYSNCGIPLMYENRTGFSASAFQHSPVNNDSRRLYSAEVDKNIYLYSIGAIKYANEYTKIQQEIWLIRGSTIFALVMFLFVLHKTPTACQKRDGVFERTLKGIFIIAIILAWANQHFSMALCGYSFQCFSESNPTVILAKQDELIQDYTKNGVISEAAAEKLRATIARDQAFLDAEKDKEYP